MIERLPDYPDDSYYLGYTPVTPVSQVKDSSKTLAVPEILPEHPAAPQEGERTWSTSGVWSEASVFSGEDSVPLEQSDYVPVQEVAPQPEPTPEPVVSEPIKEPEVPEPEQPELSKESNTKQDEAVAAVPEATTEEPASEPEAAAKQPDLSNVAAMLATAAAVKMTVAGSTTGLNSKVENRNTKQTAEPAVPNQSREKTVSSQESQQQQNEKIRPEDLVIPPRRKFKVPDEYGFHLSAKQSARYATAPSGATRNEQATADLVNSLLGSMFGNSPFGRRNEQLKDPLKGYPDLQFARDIIYHEAGRIDNETKAILKKDPDSSLARKESARRNDLLQLVDKAIIGRDGTDLSRVAHVYDRIQVMKAQREAQGKEFDRHRITRIYARAQHRADMQLASGDLDPNERQQLESMKERARIAFLLKRPDGTYPFL